MKILNTLFLTAGLTATAGAQIISVQTQGPGFITGGLTPLSSTQAAGVIAEDNWNVIADGTRTITNTKDDTGATTAIDFSIANNNSWGSRVFTLGHDTSNNGRLFNSGMKSISTHAGAPNGTGFFDLGTTQLWDVYVYTASESTGLALNVTLTGAAVYDTYYVTSQGTNAGAIGTYTTTFDQGTNTVNPSGGGVRDSANYVKWSNVQGAAALGGSLIFNFTGTNANTAITGFQLVAVPEPTTALMLIGTSGMFLMFRRRKANS